MTDVAIQVDHVWKKFSKGEFHDSLRDLIPAMARKLLRKEAKTTELKEQEFWALKDVSFEVKKGESLGIIGPNGAGKSTMLKLLSRIIRPNKGEYNVNGRVSALIEVGAGFHPDLTGRENIYLSGTILGMSKKEIKAKEDQIIDFAGVESFIETPVKRYSSGMTARLGFAVAAHMEPDVLLVDEVLSVGDAMFRSKCIRHMQELIRSNVTVVFISHILEQVRTLCERTVVLDFGQVAFDGDTDLAIKKYIDLLSTSPSKDIGPESSDVFLENIRFTDENYDETLTWHTGSPAAITFDLVSTKATSNCRILLNFATMSGTYLGTANSRLADIEIPSKPGRYSMRYVLPSVPFPKGDYSLTASINDGEAFKCIWSTSQPRTISVQSEKYSGGIVCIDGDWSILPDAPSIAKTAQRLAENSSISSH